MFSELLLRGYSTSFKNISIIQGIDHGLQSSSRFVVKSLLFDYQGVKCAHMVDRLSKIWSQFLI